MSFEKLNVTHKIIDGLRDEGIVEPTDIQQQAIPLILDGKDVIGISHTGSGKTAAFGVPVLDLIKPGQGVKALVLAPTRELAVQICGEMDKFGKYLDFHSTTIFGGVAIDPQINELKRADIVVGTPGRVLDHLGRGTMDLSDVDVVVLDEADKMSEMGFVEDIMDILDFTPADTQLLLFGATIDKNVGQIQKHYMKDPVTTKAQVIVADRYLEQFYYDVERHEKFSLLCHLLNTEECKQTIVFSSTIRTVELISHNLKRQGIESEMIHGKMTQSRRLKVIDRFNQGQNKVLIASPVAARGLDIQDVSHIFNYDLSEDAEEYLHRVGRTARAGEYGKAITLLSQRDYETFSNILNQFDLDIKELELNRFPRVPFSTNPRGNGRRNGRDGGYRNGGGNGYRNGGRSGGRNGRSDGRSNGRSNGRREGRGFGNGRGYN